MSNERVLIVEDEKIIAIDLQRRLERFGYVVIGTAGEGYEAIDLAIKHNPDIILMDIMLSGPMDGIETAKAISLAQNIPLIFLTAYTDEKTLERAKEVEPYGYILKPFKERELYTTIDIALYKHKMTSILTRQERLFNAILQSINDGIIAIDLDLNIQFMNRVAEQITGVEEAVVRSKNITSVLNLTDPVSKKDILSGIKRLGIKNTFFKDINLKNRAGQT